MVMGQNLRGGGNKIWPYIESVLVLFYLDLVFQPVSCNAQVKDAEGC